jgi:hypothetical protein
LVLIFGGCSSLCPFQQIRYSNDPHLKRMKEEMNKEEAVRLLRMYIRDNAETKHYFDVLYLGAKLREQYIQENTLVNEELISYDITASLELTKLDQTKTTILDHNRENRSQSSFVMKYKDVKKIKLYTYKEIFRSYYKVYLYDKSNNTIFWFSLPCKNQGEQKVYKLLTALSVLIPHAKEEYNEDDTQSYIDPKFKGTY